MIKENYGVSVLLANVAAIIFARKLPIKGILNIEASINRISGIFIFSKILVEYQLWTCTNSRQNHLISRVFALGPSDASFFSGVM